LNEKVNLLDKIYLGCMNDIIAEISKKCLEQGYLLEQIWNSHINIFQKIIEEAKEFKSTKYHRNNKKYNSMA